MSFKKIQTIKNIKVFFNEPLKNHTTFKIGGPADALVIPETIQSTIEIIDFCKKNDIIFFVLGKGSNLLFSDNGFRGVIIKISENLNNVTLVQNFNDSNKALITAQAGAKLAAVSKFCVTSGYSGLEFAGGIPGTIGGAVAMNAGAYEQSIQSSIFCVKYIDENGKLIERKIEPTDLGYRHSFFSQNGYTVLEASFVATKDLTNNTLTKFNDYNTKRKQNQPLEFPSAGSVFKRPLGNYASKLIQDAGLKGLTVGGAQVSQKHSGFIINIGNATAKDVLELVEKIKKKVLQLFNVTLELEIKLIGFDE